MTGILSTLPPLHVTIDDLDTGDCASYFIEGAQWVEYDPGLCAIVIQRPTFERVQVPVPTLGRVAIGAYSPLNGPHLLPLPEDGEPVVPHRAPAD